MAHLRKRMTWILLQLMAILTMSACAHTDNQIHPTETLSSTHSATETPATPTATITPIASPMVSHPTEEQVWILPTTSFRAPPLTFGMEIHGPCLSEEPEGNEFPDPDQLRWNRREENLSELTGFMNYVHTFELSPDGSWVLLELLVPRELEYELIDESALYLTNMNSSEAWLVSDSGYIYADRYVWLSGDRFLWVDQERVFAADLDGSNREDLKVPESIWQVWQGKAGIVLAQGESRMWLLDPVARTWTGMDIPSFSLTTVAHDGSYALSLGGAQDEDLDFALYHFGLDVAAQAEMLVESKIVGGHGEPPRRPRQLGVGQYWNSGEWLSFEGRSIGALGIIDVDQGSVIPISEFMGLDKDNYTIASFSPDGRWINVQNIGSEDYEIIGIDSPETQWSVEGRVLAWLEGADAALVQKTEKVKEGSQTMTKASLLRVNLSDGTSSVFLTDLADETPEILASGDRIYVREDISEIRAYSPEGKLLGTLSFPQGVVPSIETLEDHRLIISFEATAKHDQEGHLCRKRALWIWQP